MFIGVTLDETNRNVISLTVKIKHLWVSLSSNPEDLEDAMVLVTSECAFVNGFY